MRARARIWSIGEPHGAAELVAEDGRCGNEPSGWKGRGVGSAPEAGSWVAQMEGCVEKYYFSVETVRMQSDIIIFSNAWNAAK